MFDVIVIGAGPAGSYTALNLAAMGYKTAVLEQKGKAGDNVCCTGIIGQECMAHFDIDERVILRRANSAKLFSPSGRLIRLWRPETQACIVDRSALDSCIAHRAQARGARYIMNSRVQNIEAEDDGVRVEITHQECRVQMEARAAVIATGFGSKLTERLRLGSASDFVIGAQAEVQVINVNEVEVYFGGDIAPGFFAWLVPTTANRALAGLMSRRNPRFYMAKFMSWLIAQRKIVSKAEPAYAGIPLKPIARTYAHRLVVVGDAAGQVKPTTGGGVYYGLLCAEIAANVLHQALSSNALSARSLAAYEHGWKRKLGPELATGYRARKFYERLNDGQIDLIFDMIGSHGIDQAQLSFDWHGRTLLGLFKGRLISEIAKMTKLPNQVRGKNSKTAEVSFHE